MPLPAKRERLVTAALHLFSEHGFHATGIDQIVESAGVSKKTLYNHFRSKDELILAVLAHHDSAFRNGFVRDVEALAESPRERLLAIYDVAEQWFGQPGFFGCLFINAIAEHSDAKTEIRRSCQSFKRRMHEYIRELVLDSQLEPAEAISEELSLLLEGAIVTAQMDGSAHSARVARGMAARVLAPR